MVHSRIAVSVSGAVIRIDCGAFGLDFALERISEILPIVERVLLADEAWWELSDEEVESRFRGRLARDMIYQASLSRALSAADELFDVVSCSNDGLGVGVPEEDLE